MKGRMNAAGVMLGKALRKTRLGGDNPKVFESVVRPCGLQRLSRLQRKQGEWIARYLVITATVLARSLPFKCRPDQDLK